MKKLSKITLLLLTLLIQFFTYSQTVLPSSGGLLINEFSNGSSGTKEFYEFIIAGKCGEKVDVRGYIIDDNNGTFSNPNDYPAGTGIATGHLRLTNHTQWENIPVGSIIVVYNASVPNTSLPADDPYDNDNDSLYVIPHDNTDLFEISYDIPNSGDPDSTYTPSIYNSTSWAPLGIRNGGDAVQVRQPDGTYFHGVSYGGSEISGGPYGTKIYTGNMGGMNGYFNSGDHNDINNWSVGSAPTDETPGTYNNTLNEEWLRSMRDSTIGDCPIAILPIQLKELTITNENNTNIVNWITLSETNNSHFILERSTYGKQWKTICQKQGMGNTTNTTEYVFYDRGFGNSINYYRLTQVDYDGESETFNIISIDNRMGKPIKTVNLQGQEVNDNYRGIVIDYYSNGKVLKRFNK